ncbi:protein translocase subunit SecD [Deltaproteobacteria bacterium]|nr:protein translocase subunit SecD [Deltaproteobacteria bacterium]
MALLYLTPSLSENVPQWWSSVLPQEKIRLGLDLQGGMHLVLEVEAMKAVESDLERSVEEIKEDLRENKIRYLDLMRNGTIGVDLTLMREEDRTLFVQMQESQYPDYEIEPGEKVEKGVSIRMVLKQETKDQIMQLATDQALETIRNRIDQFGVTEPDIRPQEDNRILIQLPGIKDTERAIELIGKTAQLEFKLVDEENSLEAALKGNIPAGREILYEVSVDPKTGSVNKVPYLLRKRTSLTGEYISDASVSLDSQYNEPYVSLSFNNKGARIFERVTGENIENRLAIVLDNNVYSAPVIQDKISGGKAQITGRFTTDEARDLAIVLRAGALPAPVKIMEERTVGPSLGKDSIEKGFKSMVIGGIIVVIFMIIYYGFSGIIADLALILNILFIMAGLAFFGATLTLPGIAGIILTIGMAVDANVLVFERIREEMRLGKSPRTAIEGGYEKALVTILDANVTTFIAALVLFQFGTGAVRGFAVTLSIGIVASFITAVFVTRIVFDFLFVYRNWKKLSI